MSIRQRIEANNIRHLAGQQVTLSFHIYNATSNATSIQVQMDRANAVDNFSSVTQFFTTTLGSLSDTSKRSITVTLPAEARNGVEVRFITSALTSGIFVLHTVQLEPGPVATPFESRPIGTEFTLCERYYQSNGHAPSASQFSGDVTNGQEYQSVATFGTLMRTIPNITLTNFATAGFPTTVGSINASARGFQEQRTANNTGRGAFVSSYIAHAEL
jgi:hypothetical protein